jgi:O-antigen ligase
MIRLSFNETLRLHNIQITSIGLYYFFNFIDRDISNIFLLVALACCVFDYKGLYKNIKKQRALVISVFLFSIWVTLVGIYHNSPMHELDNYYRFLLLIPLLMITTKDHQLIFMLNMCALGALGHLFWTYIGGDIGRYQGTSSNAITYANLCALFFIMCIYFYFIKKNYSIYLLLSGLIFLFILVLTQTRGPLIGIMISFIYLTFITRSKLLVSIISIIVLSVVFIPNPIIDRIKIIKQVTVESNIDSNNTQLIRESRSINQRVFYLQYGFEKLKNHSLVGLGPNHFKEKMLSYTEKNKINIKSRDHLHNEFLDISVKFGIPALILLLLIYFVLYKLSNKDNRVMMNLILIMLMSSQLTQSQFAHHQAITFFIVLAYLITDSKNKRGYDKMNN